VVFRPEFAPTSSQRRSTTILVACASYARGRPATRTTVKIDWYASSFVAIAALAWAGSLETQADSTLSECFLWVMFKALRRSRRGAIDVALVTTNTEADLAEEGVEGRESGGDVIWSAHDVDVVHEREDVHVGVQLGGAKQDGLYSEAEERRGRRIALAGSAEGSQIGGAVVVEHPQQRRPKRKGGRSKTERARSALGSASVCSGFAARVRGVRGRRRVARAVLATVVVRGPNLLPWWPYRCGAVAVVR
jgi:hypothetical protein